MRDGVFVVLYTACYCQLLPMVPRPHLLHEGFGSGTLGQNLGLADSALPEIWRADQIADHVVRMAAVASNASFVTQAL